MEEAEAEAERKYAPEIELPARIEEEAAAAGANPIKDKRPLAELSGSPRDPVLSKATFGAKKREASGSAVAADLVARTRQVLHPLAAIEGTAQERSRLYLMMHQAARRPSFQPIFLPSS